MSIEIRKAAPALLASMVVATSAYAQTSSDQPSAVKPSAVKPGTLQTVIISGNRPALNVIPLQATFSQSAITPEAILNITPDRKSVV